MPLPEKIVLNALEAYAVQPDDPALQEMEMAVDHEAKTITFHPGMPHVARLSTLFKFLIGTASTAVVREAMGGRGDGSPMLVHPRDLLPQVANGMLVFLARSGMLAHVSAAEMEEHLAAEQASHRLAMSRPGKIVH